MKEHYPSAHEVQYLLMSLRVVTPHFFRTQMQNSSEQT